MKYNYLLSSLPPLAPLGYETKKVFIVTDLRQLTTSSC